jgi:hypothetical protein
MFATNEEVAKLVYKRVRLAQLESDSIESYSRSDYDVTDSALIKHPILAKLRSLVVILRNDKFN